MLARFLGGAAISAVAIISSSLVSAPTASAAVNCTAPVGSGWVKYLCSTVGGGAGRNSGSSSLTKTKNRAETDNRNARIVAYAAYPSKPTYGYGVVIATYPASRSAAACGNTSNYTITMRCDYYTIDV